MVKNGVDERPRSLGMSLRRSFRPGESIAHRSVDKAAGTVMTVLAQIVVHDDPQSIVTYMPVGSLTKRRTGARGGPRGRQLIQWDGGYEDKPWRDTNVLMIHRPGDGYSLWYAWAATDPQRAWWYVNLEEPWRRSAIGFDSRDLWLDLWREASASEWNWKDEDELDWATANGRCSAERAEDIRAEARRAIDAIAARVRPFDVDWTAWRPDSRWSAPQLPAGWRTEALA